KRKIKELILSVELEREYSKKDILTGYLNAAPYGGIEYGVQAASQDYFHKNAKDLTLDEATMLAAIPKSPTFYSPYNKTDFDKDALIGRQHYILDLMEQQGMITTKERDDAKKVDVLAKIQDRPQHFAGIQAPWFVLTAKEELERRFSDKAVKRGGWKVITTLDLNAQHTAEDQVQKGLAQVRRQGGDTAAFVAEDVKTGQVVALVGGTDFNDTDHGQNNYAHDLELPPGSSFKPYDYTALIDTQKNAGAGSVLYDAKGAIPGYPCTTGVSRTGNCVIDYDLRFPGPLSLRYALGGSRNIPAIKSMLIVGVDQTIAVAHKLMTNYGDDGKPDPTIGNYKCYYDEKNTQQAPCYASSAIGDGAYLRLDEHVHGYATLSRNGLNIPQTYIMKVTDAANKTVTEWKPSKGVQAVDPQTAYIVDDMISDPNASYFPSPKPQRYKNWKFGVKTGTTNDSKDGLMMMMSTQYASGVWVGYHNRQKVMSGFMETMTAPIVNGWMKAMHDKLTPVDRVKPAGIQTLPAFIVRSHVGVGSIEPSPSTDLFPSWYKQPGKANGTNQNIDQVSNKLATECTPQRAIKQVSNADSNTFSIDKFVNGGAAQTTDKDDVHLCSDAKPTVSLTQSGNTLVATVQPGTHPLSSDQFPGVVNFLVDGQVVYSANVSNDNVTASYTPDLNFDGNKDFTAQVIDSVLYDNTSNVVSVTGNGGGGGNNSGPLALATPSTTGNGANKKTVFNWSGGTPPYIVYNAVSSTALCNSNSTTCSVLNALAPSGTKVYVKDNNGNGQTSNTQTVP
ncbi:MAG TPA: transglycosylase domain-containing protein, partial [Patescibacteria group bacterium]|nr:transglycosylase domain-containing protein [Patescibacteria group bacterium]